MFGLACDRPAPTALRCSHPQLPPGHCCWKDSNFEPALISSTIDEVQPKLCTFLASTTVVEARISAGEALCALFEIGLKNLGDDFRFRNHAELVDVLADLALDSSKQRVKRDKKLKTDDIPSAERRAREALALDGCHAKLLYDALCQLLRSDLNRLQRGGARTVRPGTRAQ
ncbi:hypothetical protein niasHT_000029 [Heterodera trifolii]|uniref:Interferon-related developmental regulator N-terminal domain-containing protein n=1 Tax=Heterodera trifolii TaxID=157864 RepID=A0ABD2M8M6_9BILA